MSFVEIETITEDKYYHPIISINKDYFLQIVDKCRSIELRQYFVNGIQVRSFGYDFCKESGIEIITIARIDSEIEIIKNKSES